MPGFLDDFLGSFTNNQANSDANNVDYKNGLDSYLGFGNNGISNSGYDPAFTGQWNGSSSGPGTDDPVAFQNWLSAQHGLGAFGSMVGGTLQNILSNVAGKLTLGATSNLIPQSQNTLANYLSGLSANQPVPVGYDAGLGGIVGSLPADGSMPSNWTVPGTNYAPFGQGSGYGADPTGSGQWYSGDLQTNIPGFNGTIGSGTASLNPPQPGATLPTDPGVTVAPPYIVNGGMPSTGGVESSGGFQGGSGSTGGSGGFNPGGINTLPPFTVTAPAYTPPATTAPGITPVTNPVQTPVPDPTAITPPGITYPQTPGTTNPGTVNAPGVDYPSTPGGGGGTTGTGTTGDRNAYPEGLAQNYAESALAPQQFGQYAAYSPAYAAQDAKNLGVSLFGQGGPSTIAGQYAALTHGQQDPLLQQQNSIASGLLANGGNLSPSELRNVQQSSRAGFAARGLDATNASVVDEAMQTDAQRRARLLQNMGIAQNVVGQNQAQTGLINSNNASLFGLANNMTTASNAYARNQFDPFNTYGMDLANTNYNAGQARGIANQNQATALQIAQMNAAAAKQGGILSGIGSLIGGSNNNGGIFCWVARAVFGEDNPKWLQFREWMLTKAPNETFGYYLMHGEELAERVKASPELKAELLPLMENCILELKAA